jgi:hypothetical protein
MVVTGLDHDGDTPWRGWSAGPTHMGGANSVADDRYDARIIRVHGFNPHIQENLSAWRFLRPTSY